MADDLVISLIRQEIGENVTAETELDSLPMDSLDFLNLLASIEQATGKRISDEMAVSFTHVGDISEYLAHGSS